MKDSKVTHFLKNFPAQYILSALFLVVLWLYVQTNDQFFQRVVDTILGALLGILTGRWMPQANQIIANDLNNITADEINTAVEKIEEK